MFLLDYSIMCKMTPDKDPYGTGLKIGVYWWDGTEKHKQFIKRCRHVAAIKAALKKNQFVENNDLTEEELSEENCIDRYTPD